LLDDFAPMLTWLNKQGVESADGFVWQRMDRYFYHYIEGERVLKVEVEPGIHHEDVHVSSLADSQPPISQSDQTRIRANISAALDFMGIPHQFS
jgi:hypothetical protein